MYQYFISSSVNDPHLSHHRKICSLLSALYAFVGPEKWLHKTRDIISKWTPQLNDSLPNTYDTAGSYVYFVFSIKTHHSYIGETNRSLLKRFIEEMSVANRNTDKHKRYESIVNHVGSKHFAIIPIIQCQTDIHSERLRLENAMINFYHPTMNSHRFGVNKQSKHRFRPIKSIRDRTNKSCGGCRTVSCTHCFNHNRRRPQFRY